MTSLMARAYGLRRSFSEERILETAWTAQGTPTIAIFVYFRLTTAVLSAARNGTHQLYRLPASCNSCSLEVTTIETGRSVNLSSPTVTTASIIPVSSACARIPGHRSTALFPRDIPGCFRCDEINIIPKRFFSLGNGPGADRITRTTGNPVCYLFTISGLYRGGSISVFTERNCICRAYCNAAHRIPSIARFPILLFSGPGMFSVPSPPLLPSILIRKWSGTCRGYPRVLGFQEWSGIDSEFFCELYGSTELSV